MKPDEHKEARKELDRLLTPDLPVRDQLAVMKEIIRLLEKNPVPDDAADDDAESETLAEVRQHLEPLGLAPEGTPLPELARLAALRIVEKSGVWRQESE